MCPTFENFFPFYSLDKYKETNHSSLPIVIVGTIKDLWSIECSSLLSIVHKNKIYFYLELTQTEHGVCCDANQNFRS